MLLHTLMKWSSMSLVHLWPYGLRMANEIYNTMLTKHTNISLVKKFSAAEVCPKLKPHHAFSCPIYLLDNHLKAQQSLPKWQSRAWLGVDLGPSPSHVRSISLVLNLRTGHVSPQFHVNMMISSKLSQISRKIMTHLKQFRRNNADSLR